MFPFQSYFCHIRCNFHALPCAAVMAREVTLLRPLVEDKIGYELRPLILTHPCVLDKMFNADVFQRLFHISRDWAYSNTHGCCRYGFLP